MIFLFLNLYICTFEEPTIFYLIVFLVHTNEEIKKHPILPYYKILNIFFIVVK